MTEKEWVSVLPQMIKQSLSNLSGNLKVELGFRLPYSSFIESYIENKPNYPEFPKSNRFETDI